MDSLISLKDKFAIVTGASRGIGKDTAILLAKLGADVLINYNNASDEAQRTADEVRSYGRKAYVLSADVSSASEVKKMFKYIEETIPQIDILVNNAGVGDMNYLKYMTEEQWDSVLDVNLKGTFLCSKYAVKNMMRNSAGCIVNVSSIAAVSASVKQCNYAASKAGVIAFTKSIAKELGPFGIRANVVAPGPVYTDMNVMSSREEETVKKSIPLGNIAEPRDISLVIAFLCSSMARYLTGQVICADGGFTL